jgi:hypothetical protein
MRYERSTIVKLHDRYSSLVKASYQAYGDEIRYLRNFVVKTSSLRAVVQLLELAEPELDPDKWITEHFAWQEYSWPPTEVGRAKVCWRLIVRWAEGEDPRNLAMNMTSENNFNQMLRAATTAIVEPVVKYLEEALGSSSDIIYLLEKYRRRVEWFEQARLYADTQGDRSVGETAIDRDLRQFLFDQGIDYPFSQPASASGKADVVSGLESDDPLVCELKLYDGESYPVSYLAKGANQAYRYARDYGKPAAYLVIANLSDERLQIESDADPREWPPRLNVAGVVIFFVVVQVKPLSVASKQRAATTRTIARADLLTDTD